MAAIGPIDEQEERFLACYGADLDTLSRQETVRTYAILEEEVTVIEDLAADPRFDDGYRLENATVRF